MIRGSSVPVAGETYGADRVELGAVSEMSREEAAWASWLQRVAPMSVARDVQLTRILKVLVRQRWIDLPTTGRATGLSPQMALSAVLDLSRATIRNRPVIHQVAGVPDNAGPAWALTDDAVVSISDLYEMIGVPLAMFDRDDVAKSYAYSRHRISTTELGSILSVTSPNMGRILKGLEASGYLAPGREMRRGAGFFYVWARPRQLRPQKQRQASPADAATMEQK